MKTVLEQVDAALEEIERRKEAAVLELLQPLLIKEFKRVQKRHPRLKRILFGNGTYLLDGVQDLIVSEYRQASIGGGLYVTIQCPKYLERLWELCERSSRRHRVV